MSSKLFKVTINFQYPLRPFRPLQPRIMTMRGFLFAHTPARRYGTLRLYKQFCFKVVLNRVQFETRSTNLPKPPRGRRSELESTGFKLDAV